MDSQLGTRTRDHRPQQVYAVHAIIIYMDSRLRRIAVHYLQCLSKHERGRPQVEWFEERLLVELVRLYIRLQKYSQLFYRMLRYSMSVRPRP